jgi:hypothetical protein
MSDAPVLLDLTDGVATITLNRPDAMNSLDVATKVSLLEAVRSVAENPDARCVVLTGSGRAFCTGQDLKEHIQLLENGGSEQLFTTVDDHYNPIVSTLASKAKPVIAAVNGIAAGAGASLAFACDLIVAAAHGHAARPAGTRQPGQQRTGARNGQRRGQREGKRRPRAEDQGRNRQCGEQWRSSSPQGERAGQCHPIGRGDDEQRHSR